MWCHFTMAAHFTLGLQLMVKSPCGAMPCSWRRRCEADDHSDVMSPCWCEANDDSSVKLLYRIYYSLVDFPTIAGRQTIA